MLDELLKIREDLREAQKAEDYILIGFAINKLDTFMHNYQNKLQ